MQNKKGMTIKEYARFVVLCEAIKKADSNPNKLIISDWASIASKIIKK